jgi:hypothetical protein
MGWLIALIVVAAIAYGVWEFRWYFRTLTRTWRSEAERDKARAPREPETAARPR